MVENDCIFFNRALRTLKKINYICISLLIINMRHVMYEECLDEQICLIQLCEMQIQNHLLIRQNSLSKTCPDEG